MNLKRISYSQFSKGNREWRIDNVSLGEVNLLVGKNASGKTKTINIINGLAKLLAGEFSQVFISGAYQAVFENEGNSLEYELHYEEAKVIKESLSINEKMLLRRGRGGKGKIFAEKVGSGTEIEFQAEETGLASVLRRDSIQHPFLEPLYEWGKSCYHVPFSTPLGKETYLIITGNEGVDEERDAQRAVGIFVKAERRYGPMFAKLVVEDMKRIGYSISEVGVAPPISIKVHTPQQVVGLFVRESDLKCVTDQADMSQGMFRALSLLIQVNAAALDGRSQCILIDDIGEGLDFHRSCALIELLIQRVPKSKIQLILSTNDKFVMNHVPLKYWSLLERSGPIVKVYNDENSHGAFESFKETGLSNFDFLTLDFLNVESDEKIGAVR